MIKLGKSSTNKLHQPVLLTGVTVKCCQMCTARGKSVILRSSGGETLTFETKVLGE